MKYAIVGCGVSGTLVLLELLDSGIQPEDIALVDTNFDGGSLGRHWGSIQSNTTWKQIQTAMMKYPSAQKGLETLSKKYEEDNTCSLYDLSWLLFESIQPFLQRCETYIGRCESIQESEGGWKLVLKTKTCFANTVFLCQGGKQKEIDYGKPTLNLDSVFDLNRCKRYINGTDTVTLFGTAHSGTLAIRNLLEIGCRIYAIHRGQTPFLYARDNNYDGIKKESAEIADKIQETKPQQLTFVHINDISTLVKAIQKSKWIINCTGFEGASLRIVSKENNLISEFQYSPETAEIAPNVYGFGLAYPGVTTIDGKLYQDVSIPSFLDQIRRTLPSILSKNNAS